MRIDTGIYLMLFEHLSKKFIAQPISQFPKHITLLLNRVTCGAAVPLRCHPRFAGTNSPGVYFNSNKNL